jgi:predicted GTPase
MRSSGKNFDGPSRNSQPEKNPSTGYHAEAPVLPNSQAATVNSLLQPVTLSDEQQKIFDLMNSTDENLFITGRAGTGKSSLLNYFKDHTRKKNRHLRAYRNRGSSRRRTDHSFTL